MYCLKIVVPVEDAVTSSTVEHLDGFMVQDIIQPIKERPDFPISVVILLNLVCLIFIAFALLLPLVALLFYEAYFLC
jgi:hypothetical protein